MLFGGFITIFNKGESIKGQGPEVMPPGKVYIYHSLKTMCKTTVHGYKDKTFKVCWYLWPTSSEYCSVLLFFSHPFAAAASLSFSCLLLQSLSSNSISSTSHSTAYCLLDSSLNQHNINPPGTPKHCYFNASSMLQEHLLKRLENCFRRLWFCFCSTLARKWLKQRWKFIANNLKDCILIMFATSNPIFSYTRLCAVALLKSSGRLWLSAGGKDQNLILCAGATPLHPPWACGAA